MNTIFGIVLVSAIANFILIVLIMIHLRSSLSGRFLFWIIFGLNGWVLSNYFSNLNSLDYVGLLYINRLIFLTTAVASWGFALFADTFPEEKFSHKNSSLIINSSFLITLLLSISPFLVKSIVPKDGVTDVIFNWGIFEYAFFVLTCLCYTVYMIQKKYFSETYLHYKKIFNLLIFGVGIFLLFAITTNLIIPYFFGIFDFTVLTPIYTTLFSFIIFWAILKHKFLNIKIIAAELLTFSVWVFLFVQIFLESNTSEKIADAGLLSLVVLFGIFLINSVKKEVQRKEELQIMADKLASANDQLRKLDNAKTEFISIASHQLRTPITSIKGYSSLVLEGSYGELSDSLKHALGKIYSSSEKLVTLIEDLLNVSRIESGRMQFAFEKANVATLVEDLYENFIPIAKAKDLMMEMNLPEILLPEIVMDYSKIREVISNIIDNALKYTEKGGVVISAEMKDEGAVIDDKGFVIPGQKSEFGKVIRITVKDTGIGIPKEEIPYLFKKFSRGKDVSRLHVGGTGLGLYVGKAIAEAHHGQVWVESEGDGKGSSFIIEIPVEHV